MKGIQQHKTYYGSLDDTIILIEASERTPLLVDGLLWSDNKNNNYSLNSNDNNSTLTCSQSSWSFESCKQNNGSYCSSVSTKSFKSHFTELKVLGFAFLLVVAIIIAIYLLVIESRLPSITLYLDLVSHDVWSHKVIPPHNHLQNNIVDHIILMQTGHRNCDTGGECLKVLKEMQQNKQEELPYNFLIGGDGQVYEVRGWKNQSSIKGIPQEQSIVIGIIGNFDQSSPKKIILLTIRSLIKETSKRHLVNRKFYIYGLRRNDHDRNEAKLLFAKLKEWPEFRGFLNENKT